jgi:hypothetical protein
MTVTAIQSMFHTRSEAAMSREVVSCVLVVSLLVYAGCSSSYVVSSASSTGRSFNDFNVNAYGKSARIVFRDGSETDVGNVVASPDSVHYVSEETGRLAVIGTQAVKTIVLTDHVAGLFEGFGYGAGAGALAVLIVSAASPGGGHEMSGADIVVAFTLIGAAGGGVIGGIWGAIVGHSNEYRFITLQGSTTIQ